MSDNKSTVVPLPLQRDLAEYGLFRKKAVDGTTKSDPFMGVRKNSSGYETKFGTGIRAIQDDNMTVAVVAPHNEPFDMLVTKDFKKAVNTASEDDLRAFLRSIVDEV